MTIEEFNAAWFRAFAELESTIAFNKNADGSNENFREELKKLFHGINQKLFNIMESDDLPVLQCPS